MSMNLRGRKFLVEIGEAKNSPEKAQDTFHQVWATISLKESNFPRCRTALWHARESQLREACRMITVKLHHMQEASNILLKDMQKTGRPANNDCTSEQCPNLASLPT